MPDDKTVNHIASITLDEESVTPRTPEIKHERSVAIHDLIEWNHFAIKDEGKIIEGPYAIRLDTVGSHIRLSATSPSQAEPIAIKIAIAPFRGLIRDYFLICESYFNAVKTGNLQRIEAIDMSRRGLHNEGADLLASSIAGKADMDTETARRLFTLICALHLK